MTEKQRKFYYFAAWRRCAESLGWVMAGGCIKAVLDDQVEEARMYQRMQQHSPAWDERLQVIATAQHLALQAHRAVTADDLRHACTWLVTKGRTTASSRLKHAEISRCVHLFNLLQDPDSLSAIDAWLDPEDAERRSFVRFLENQNPKTLGAIRAIAADRWPNADRPWNFRPLDDIKWLWSQVRDRVRKPRTPQPADIPF